MSDVVAFKPGPKSKLEQNFGETIRMLGELGALQCTQSETAAVLGVSRWTLEKFFKYYPEAVEAFDAGADSGRASLRRLQWLQAQRSPTMSIWLGKQWLGQRDKHDVVIGETHEEGLRALA